MTICQTGRDPLTAKNVGQGAADGALLPPTVGNPQLLHDPPGGGRGMFSIREVRGNANYSCFRQIVAALAHKHEVGPFSLTTS